MPLERFGTRLLQNHPKCNHSHSETLWLWLPSHLMQCDPLTVMSKVCLWCQHSARFHLQQLPFILTGPRELCQVESGALIFNGNEAFCEMWTGCCHAGGWIWVHLYSGAGSFSNSAVSDRVTALLCHQPKCFTIVMALTMRICNIFFVWRK